MPGGVEMQKAQMKSQALTQQTNAAMSLGQMPDWKAAKRDEYANNISVERREHDAVLRFKLQGEDYSTLIREITVPLGALEGLT
jgi:hypothetical protein